MQMTLDMGTLNQQGQTTEMMDYRKTETRNKDGHKTTTPHTGLSPPVASGLFCGH